MPDTKITALTAIGANPIIPATFPIPMVDLTDTSMAASGTTKKVTVNQILGAGGTATLASATITGDLTVRSGNKLKLFRSDNATSTDFSDGGSGVGTIINNLNVDGFRLRLGGNNVYNVAGDGTYAQTWFNGAGGTWMTLNATGLGVGGVPSNVLTVRAAQDTGLELNSAASNSSRLITAYDPANSRWYINSTFNGSGTTLPIAFLVGNTERMRIDTSGNVGIGVTPSAINVGRGLEVGAVGNGLWCNNSSYNQLLQNAYNTSISATGWRYAAAASTPAVRVQLGGGEFNVYNAVAGTAGNDLTWTPRLTLDASGNLLVGTTTSAGKFTLTQSANADSVSLTGNSGNFLRIYGWSVDNTWNANATAIFVGKQTSTSRSINAGGTVNASGADYAEYMTKGSDFVLSKGGIAGIDANGKLTNVFADAVSFVVKSTDPSYVGNDKWGVGLEGDALEAARQLVDRIAFAGQVPVNVTGAKAGDYIVPVVDGTGIKGIAVSNPTFEQYQLAVGKVIAIDADGRARIIVKVA